MQPNIFQNSEPYLNMKSKLNQSICYSDQLVGEQDQDKPQHLAQEADDLHVELAVGVG